MLANLDFIKNDEEEHLEIKVVCKREWKRTAVRGKNVQRPWWKIFKSEVPQGLSHY